MNARSFPHSLTVALVIFAPCARASESSSEIQESVKAAPADVVGIFWSGKRAYESGDYERAQEQFEKAYALTREPEVLFDIAQAQRKSGKCDVAILSYQQFLRVAPESALAPRAEKQVAELQAACRSATNNHSEPEMSQQPVAIQVQTKRTLAVRSKTAPPVLVHPKQNKAMLGWSAVAFGSGLIVGGVATGLQLWNQGRYEQWRTRDANLARGTGSNETPSQWLVRQQANDEFGHSINRIDTETLIFGLGAGALLTTSAILFFSSSTTSRGASYAQNSVPSFAVGPKHVSLALTW